MTKKNSRVAHPTSDLDLVLGSYLKHNVHRVTGESIYQEGFEGEIDGFNMWSVGLSATEIMTVKNGELVQSDNLVVSYDFDSPDGDWITDVSGNSRDGEGINVVFNS